MSIFSRKNRQRGEIFLTVLFITLIGGTVLYTTGRVMQSEKHNVDVVHDKLNRGEMPTDAEFDRAKQALTNVRKLGGASAQTLNTITKIGAPSPDEATGKLIQTLGEQSIDVVVDASLREPEDSSNPLPANVPRLPVCTPSSKSSCTTKSACTAAGGYWHSDSTCQSEPGCDRTHLSLCEDKYVCRDAGGYWHSDNVCRNTPDCDSEHLDVCTNRIECTGAGGYWHSDNKCRDTPDCDIEHLYLCANSGECTAAGGFWYDSQCNQSAASCYAGTFSNCRTESDCGNAGGYWYSGSCHRDPEDPCGDGGSFNCSNGTVICADRACNNSNDCGDDSDEANCGTESSCCVSTNGCPSETATSCGATCCCCPYGQACNRANPAMGCVSM